ncbi:glycosyl hydrolases family 18-domain-containing protein [Chytriomyces sp. MP71]|nr:glycosyl hydrolases family 18-domain-containing protein [Chytriomyces sp. MP71]
MARDYFFDIAKNPASQALQCTSNRGNNMIFQAIIAAVSLVSSASAVAVGEPCTFGSAACDASGNYLQCGGEAVWSLWVATPNQFCTSKPPASSSAVPPASSSVKPVSSSAKPSTTASVPPATSAKPSSSVVPPTSTAKPSSSGVSLSPKPPSSSVVPRTTTSMVVSTSSSAAPATTGTSALPLCYPKYNAAYTYNKGTGASANAVNYVAKYQGAGAPPSDAWTTEGPCDTSSYNYRPFTTPGVIGYWAQWSMYSRAQNYLDKLDLSGFSAINYAFLNVDANANLVSFDSYADPINIPILNGPVRLKYPNLRTIISIGGWSGSHDFSTIFASSSLTATFVKNVHTYLDANGFDGVDIDYEYPGGGGQPCNTVTPNDAANFAKALAALRTELGPNRSISIAVSALTERYISNGVQYIPDIAKSVNYIQIMSYDFYGSWAPYSDFNSPLFAPGPNDPQEPTGNKNIYNGQSLSISGAVQAWSAAGAPLSKLVAGVAFYGRSWSVQPGTTNGLYQPCNGSFNGTACPGIIGDFLDVAQYCEKPCGDCYHAGVWMYMNLRGQTNQNMQGGALQSQANAPLATGWQSAANGWTRKYYSFAENPTLYSSNYNSGASTGSSFISYDDPQSIQAKAKWAKGAGVGGLMIW